MSKVRHNFPTYYHENPIISLRNKVKSECSPERFSEMVAPHMEAIKQRMKEKGETLAYASLALCNELAAQKKPALALMCAYAELLNEEDRAAGVVKQNPELN